jgi:hypothetical protein
MVKNCLYCGTDLKYQRSTKKYCNDNCKQLAYYKRKGISLSGNSSNNSTSTIKPEDVIVKEPLTVKQGDFMVSDNKEEKIIPINEKQSSEPEKQNKNQDEKENTVTKDVIVKPVESEIPSNTIKQEEKTLTVKNIAQKEESYEWEESEFINRIREFIDESEEEVDKFLHPEKYWHPNDIQYIQWVTARVRCLIESVIKISNSPHIDRQTLLEVADAVHRLVCCDLFKLMPKNYPCTKWMTELNEKIQAFAIANQDCETIRLRLSPQRKAELIAKRFAIGNFVSKIKFSELNFETAMDKIS